MKRAKIVVFGSAKGDQGKTTLAFNLAVQRTKRGRRVLFIDTDTQRSATNWADRRLDAKAEPALITEIQVGRSIITNIESKAADYDDIIVDTQGADSMELRGAATLADILISPVKPLQAAIETLDRLYFALLDVKKARPDLPMLLLSNCVHPRASPEGARAELMDYIDGRLPIFQVAETVIHMRSSHDKAMRRGLSVSELAGEDNAKAQEEMLKLEMEIWGNE